MALSRIKKASADLTPSRSSSIFCRNSSGKSARNIHKGSGDSGDLD
ncbi:MAG: hypothetical protein EH225_07060 [Calditrichaeota bacterium]|nr:MAG: hypothetical protein EH225_07060 [Calditrichota bacterium]